jgi:hypothetical protein
MAELNFGLLTPPGSQSIGNAFVQGMDQAAVARAQENQNALSQYALSKAKREDQVKNQLLGDLRAAKTPEEQIQAYVNAGMGREAVEMQGIGLRNTKTKNEILAQPGVAAKTLAQTNAANFAAGKSRQDYRNQGLRDMANNPSDANIVANHEDAVLQGMMTKEESAAQTKKLLAIPLDQRAAIFSQAGAPAAAPEATSQEIRTMRELGYPNTPAGYIAFRGAQRQERLLTPKEEAQQIRIAGAGRASNTMAYTNVQPDGQGGYLGLNKKTGRMEQIPQDADVVAGGVLSGAALELGAQGYLMDRKLPPNLGRGKQGAMNTIKIMERAAALAKEYGMNAAETAINQIAGKAKSLALANIVKDLAAIRPYNAMLEKNGDIAISLAEKAISTNMKLANRPINWLKQNASDNPDVAEFLAQARIVTTEAARVLNNPRLVGQLTDSARHEMEAILNGDMPLESFTRVVRRLQSDGKNRVDAMVEERDSLKQSIRRPNAAGQAAPAPTAPAAVAPPTAAARPAGVGANWTFETDAKGNNAWVSPDRKSYKEAQ